VIVRLMGEGQFRVDDDLLEGLSELDDQAGEAVEQGDEESLRRLLGLMAKTVRDRGERLPDSDLSASDAIIPPEDLSLDEAKQLFEGEGLIPDLPS
jgi:PspAA-like protein